MLQSWWERAVVSAVSLSDQCSGKSAKAIFNSIAYWSSLSREKMEKLLKGGNIDINGIRQFQNLVEFESEIKPLYADLHQAVQRNLSN